MLNELEFFTKYIQKHKLNTIELLHKNKLDFIEFFRLLEHDTLVICDGKNKKIAILVYYENHQPSVWVVRFNKGGFAYGKFKVKHFTNDDLKKIYMWVNYNKGGALEIIDGGYNLYGNP